jgi:hypothetical protein
LLPLQKDILPLEAKTESRQRREEDCCIQSMLKVIFSVDSRRLVESMMIVGRQECSKGFLKRLANMRIDIFRLEMIYTQNIQRVYLCGGNISS